jgi:hypothetical protein
MASVESLQNAVRVLVAERQALHESRAAHDELEANRLELVAPATALRSADRPTPPRADRDAA